jgi:dGTPase
MECGRAPYAEDCREPAGGSPEPPSANRSAFRRDADRIIHSTAFRRLKHKTQVFVFHEGRPLPAPG